MVPQIFMSFIIALLFCSCENGFNTKKYTEEFLIKDGFQIDIVAAEPMLQAPIAIDFDLQGRIWAVEMPGYMRDIDGSDEDLPDGRIVILEDTDGDGIMDKHKIFLDSLVLPRALKCFNGGLLYAEPPNLWWVTIDENDKPGQRILVDTMYTNGGNIEHMPNGLLYNVDNWIYNARSDRRYRYHTTTGKWELSATSFRGQWGISNDIMGRLFYNDNTNPLFGDYIPPNCFNQNAFLDKKHVYRQNIAVTRKYYPAQPTSVNRGYEKGVLEPDGKVSKFTAACSPMIFKSDGLGADYIGDAFVCGPEANLIKRYKLGNEIGRVTCQMTDTISEFVVSMDETFRPVNLNEGPDGNMYIVDMRKGILQHRAYLTTYLIDKMQIKGLDRYEDGGRVYKVSKKGSDTKVKDYRKLTPLDWIELLASDKYWERIKAQEILVSHKGDDNSITDNIRSFLVQNKSNIAHIHGLRVLQGRGVLQFLDLIKSSAISTLPELKSTILILLAEFKDEINKGQWEDFIANFNEDKEGQIDLFLSNASAQMGIEIAKDKWTALAKEHAKDDLFLEALVSGIDDESQYLTNSKNNSKLNALLNTSQENRINKEPQLREMNMQDVTDPRSRGLFLYHQNCASCHGHDGKGLSEVAPPLYESPFLNGPSEHLVLIALQGLGGPLEMDGVHYEFGAMMPGIKNNPMLSDEDIRDILLWIRNSFSSSNEGFNTEMVADLREKLKDRNKVFSQAEIEAWPIDKNKKTMR